jgi:heme-degrading monooxygenase HmoA
VTWHMIVRIWHGWIYPENADAYEQLLRNEIFVGIKGREIQGFRGIKLLRDDSQAECEFVTIMEFDSIESVRQFAGDDDYERAVVPDAARKLLKKFDERSRHYELRET